MQNPMDAIECQDPVRKKGRQREMERYRRAQEEREREREPNRALLSLSNLTIIF